MGGSCGGVRKFEGGIGGTHGRVAIDSEEREICSRCRSRRDMMNGGFVEELMLNCCGIEDVYIVAWSRDGTPFARSARLGGDES